MLSLRLSRAALRLVAIFHALLPAAGDRWPVRWCKRVFMPLLFGCYAVWLGADANWDLTHYHLYNPFALLHGKASVDFAAAGMQGYFNPTLDLLPYTLQALLPPRCAGFAMGALHGLMFLLIYAIARLVWPWPRSQHQGPGVFLLAAAGTLTANYLSEIGNSMGDDSTALLVLFGLWLVLRQTAQQGERCWRALSVFCAAGLCVGCACGLKLTNAPYALALCASLLLQPARASTRLRVAFWFGIGVVIGLLASDGWWLANMTARFGNPLYPQFGTLFPHAYASAVAAADDRFLPRSLLEALLWPFIFSVNPYRTGELALHQIVWPVTYVLAWAYALQRLVRARSGTRAARMAALEPAQRLLLTYLALGYLVWLKLFGITRYLVPLEVLAPLVIALLLSRLVPAARAMRLTALLLGTCTLIVLAGGARTWGHEPWADPLYHAEVPMLAEPATSTVVLYSGPNAWAWIATRFPATTAFVGLGAGFPEGPGFAAHVRAIASTRAGPVFALIDGAADTRAAQRIAANAWLRRLGVTQVPSRCRAYQKLAAWLHVQGPYADAARVPDCSLPEDGDGARVAADNQALALAARAVFNRYGLDLEPASCEAHRAGIGTQQRVFQWCRAAVQTGTSAAP